MPGIHVEVQKNLLYLAGIYFHPPKIFLVFFVNFYVLLCEAEHLGASFDNLREINDFNVIFPSHGKTEELFGHISPLENGLLYAF